MPSVEATDLVRMRAALLFDGPDRGRKLSRFWALLLLAATIATAGVISDSTATVIGAMIVAPLMTPILGTVLSVVTGDGRNLVRSVTLVVTGAAAVIVLAWLVGEVLAFDVVAENNSQVAGRVHPRLVDLVAALATGAVGSFALVREDISDTLPGVAIAISLVPPLAVVGLTFAAGASGQSAGALLLFLTNVTAIILSGLVVMTLYRVRHVAQAGAGGRAVAPRAAALVTIAAVVALAIPLAATGRTISGEAIDEADVTDVANDWATERDWEIVNVDAGTDGVDVRAVGPLPMPDPRTFRTALDVAGLRGVHVTLELAPVTRAEL